MARSLGIRWAQLRLGLIVTTVTLVSCVLIFFIDEFAQATQQRYTLYFYTFTTQTLQPRAPVWLAGQPAGTVRRIEFLAPRGQASERLLIVLSLRAEVQPLIREGSAARVINSGIVGETVVNILPSVEGEPLPAGGVLPTEAELDPVDIARGLTAMIDSLQPVVDRWGDVYRRASLGPGTVASLGRDRDQLFELRDRLGRLAALVDSIQTGSGDLTRLLTEEEPRAAIGRLGPRLSRLGDLYRDGEIRRLLQDEEAFASLDSIAVRAGRLQRRLERAEGSLGRLIHDPALSREIERTLVMLRELRETYRALGGSVGETGSDR